MPETQFSRFYVSSKYKFEKKLISFVIIDENKKKEIKELWSRVWNLFFDTNYYFLGQMESKWIKLEGIESKMMAQLWERMFQKYM